MKLWWTYNSVMDGILLTIACMRLKVQVEIYVVHVHLCHRLEYGGKAQTTCL